MNSHRLHAVTSGEAPREPDDLEEFLAETDDVDSVSGLHTTLHEPAALDPGTGVKNSPEDRKKTS